MIQNIIDKAERVCKVFEYTYNFTVYYEFNEDMVEFTFCHHKFKFEVMYSMEKFLRMPVQAMVDNFYGIAKNHIWDWYGLK